MVSEGAAGGPVIDVYARLSHAADGSTINVDDQVEVCLETVERRGGRVGLILRDNSLSAWRPSVVRPDWDRLMRRLEAGESDGVIVYDVTRFSRKVLEGERLVELATSGVRVWSLAGEYDLATADGRRHFREAMVAAAAESDKISERVQRGKLRRARRGRPHGGGRAYAMPGWAPAPDGWQSGDPRVPETVEVVEAEREIVRECYRRLLAGETLSGLVWDLNGRTILNGRGARWTRSTLARTLIRPTLAGLVAHRGQVVSALADVEPVVSRPEWERLCALLDSRRRGRPGGRVHLLSGLVRCAGCGTPLTGGVRRSTATYPDGSPKREYRCRRDPDYPGCGRNHIDAQVAEQAVAVAVKTRLGDPRRAERIAARLSAARTEQATLEGEISRLEQAADDVTGKVAQWGVDRVDRAIQPLLRRIGQLKDERDALAQVETPAAAAADAARAWDDAQDGGDVDTLRTMIRTAFPKLTLRQPARRIDANPDRLDWDGTGSGPPLPEQPDVILDRLLAVAGPEGITAQEICDATGMSLGWTYPALRRRRRDGTVTPSRPAGRWLPVRATIS